MTLSYLISSQIDGLQNVEVFRSIPYAKPPVENLRFRISEKLPARSKISSAVFEKAACPQFGPFPFAAKEENQSEDCLHLSVYRPTGSGSLLKI